MNTVHLHLLLNHFPTIGFGVGVGLFLVGLAGKSDDLKRASFMLFFLIALLAIPVYQSGNAAQFAIMDRTDISQEAMATHQDAALLALIFMEITGAFAWLALWQFRRISGSARWNVAAVLVLSILTFGLMARAANIGGEIRHPEILEASGAPVAQTPGWLRTAAIGTAFIIDKPWMWPVCEIFHFVGLCILFGIVLLVNLRMLGVVRKVSFSALHRLLPWAIVGFGMSFVTGMFFFLAVPAQYTENTGFYWKMSFMLLAGVTILYPTMFEEIGAFKSEDDAPFQAKLIGAASIFLWVGVIFFGRMLPFLGSE
jgi:hypothetical protein